MKIEGRAFYENLMGCYLELLAKHLKLRLKMKRMEQTTTEIIEENERLHEIVKDLKNGSVY